MVKEIKLDLQIKILQKMLYFRDKLGNKRNKFKFFSLNKIKLIEFKLNLYKTNAEKSLPLSYSLLAALMHEDEHIIKSKSESALAIDTNETTQNKLKSINYRKIELSLRSRSLEHLSGYSIWNCVPLLVVLEKDTKGLGFSVIDYQVSFT